MKLSFNSYLTCAVLAAHHRRQCSARWTTSRTEQHSEDIHARHGARGCSTEWRIANQTRSGKYLCLSAAKRQTHPEKRTPAKKRKFAKTASLHSTTPYIWPPSHAWRSKQNSTKHHLIFFQFFYVSLQWCQHRIQFPPSTNEIMKIDLQEEAVGTPRPLPKLQERKT